MEVRALLHDQELLLLATVLFFHALRAVESNCTTSSVPAFSTSEFNLTSRSAINSSKGMTTLLRVFIFPGKIINVESSLLWSLCRLYQAMVDLLFCGSVVVVSV